MRDALKAYAEKEQFKFHQDSLGNAYLTQPGTDPSLSGIALTFPLDGPHQPNDEGFLSALHVFESLKHVQTACDIVLLGWTSPGSSTSSPAQAIGKQVWEGEMTREDAYAAFDELRQFDNQKLPKLEPEEEVSLSALVEVSENEDRESQGLEVEGSFVLVEKAVRISDGVAREKKSHGGGGSLTSNKAPVVRIVGKGAEEVARRLVEEYSRYVVGLFENFD